MHSQGTASNPQHMVVTSTKSAGVSILLTLFLGPLGLFYSTVTGALVMLVLVPGVAVSIALASLQSGTTGSGAASAHPLGLFALLMMSLPIYWLGTIVVGVLAVFRFNRRLMAR